MRIQVQYPTSGQFIKVTSEEMLARGYGSKRNMPSPIYGYKEVNGTYIIPVKSAHNDAVNEHQLSVECGND